LIEEIFDLQIFMLEEVFENFKLGVMFEVEAFLYIGSSAQRVLIKGIVTTTQT
jgi:hypothetical protein